MSETDGASTDAATHRSHGRILRLQHRSRAHSFSCSRIVEATKMHATVAFMS